MSKFRLIHTGGPYGDCTSRYDVKFNGPMTVREFIEEILNNNPISNHEWGTIGIACEGEIVGKPKCSYADGKITTEPLPEEYMNKVIVSCTAHGGWSLMDYKITVNSSEKTIPLLKDAITILKDYLKLTVHTTPNMYGERYYMRLLNTTIEIEDYEYEILKGVLENE